MDKGTREHPVIAEPGEKASYYSALKPDPLFRRGPFRGRNLSFLPPSNEGVLKVSKRPLK
jgi:hypothetical protein